MFEYVVLQLSKFDGSMLDIGTPDIKVWMTYFKRPHNLSHEELVLIQEEKPTVNEALSKLNTMKLEDNEFKIYQETEDWKRMLADSLEMQRRAEEKITQEKEEITKEKELLKSLKRELQQGDSVDKILSKLAKFE